MPQSADDRPLRPVPRSRYVDFKVAGEGAMGLVYLALDTELNRSVAFKIVRPDPGPDKTGDTPLTPLDATAPPGAPTEDGRFAELKARFLQEAWVTGRMEHPGIVPVYELGETEGGVPYYTMRFVRGQRTLKTAIEELHGAAFEDRLATLEPFVKLCDAVSYAHARGVIHRDLKPANVALGEFGEVVLLDWGLAKLHNDEMSSGDDSVAPALTAKDFQTDATGLGTPGYMAPETIRGGKNQLDERSDVYSLGVILYQILTGCLPFPVEPFPEYLDSLRLDEPPRAKSMNPEVPDALDALCALALCRDKDRRVESVRALSDGVRQWQTQSALDRELEGMVRDAKTALSAAEDARGPARIRQTQRALAMLTAAQQRMPDRKALQLLQTQARNLRNRGIQETQSQSRRRIALVGGFILLVVAAITAFVVASMLNERRKEAEDAKRATEAALTEASTQRESAQREKRAALRAKREAERRADVARQAHRTLASVMKKLQSGARDGSLGNVFDETSDEAVRRGDADSVFLMIESARDAQRFARLAVGHAARDQRVPADLVEAEQSTRRRSGELRLRYLQVADGTPNREVKREWDTAEAAFQVALDKVLNALVAQVDESLAATATLAQVQAALMPDEVLVNYGRVKGEGVAVVVQRDAGWLVELGPQSAIDEAATDLQAAIRERRSITDARQALASLVLQKLALPPTDGRVIIAPQGSLLLVPFDLLMPDREAYVVPGAGAFLHLRKQAPAAGDGVLALADALSTQGPVTPGPREEARAVGTTTLLGRDAAWTRLSALLSSRERWHAVHLACAGKLMSESQDDGFLSLTPQAQDDGVLKVPEIARLDCRSDLVVLSSASTDWSPSDVEATTLAMPQALMYAGARRVLFATFFTDDEATQALMVKFYELWSPRDASRGLEASAALKRAQAFVRTHEKWQDPVFWSAWVLWGLPD